MVALLALQLWYDPLILVPGHGEQLRGDPWSGLLRAFGSTGRPLALGFPAVTVQESPRDVSSQRVQTQPLSLPIVSGFALDMHLPPWGKSHQMHSSQS